MGEPLPFDVLGALCEGRGWAAMQLSHVVGRTRDETSKALQRLKRRRLAEADGHIWRATAYGVHLHLARQFLGRFVARGWLCARRSDPAEQRAVDLGLHQGWLRRELSEAHFTPKGREVLGHG